MRDNRDLNSGFSLPSSNRRVMLSQRIRSLELILILYTFLKFLITFLSSLCKKEANPTGLNSIHGQMCIFALIYIIVTSKFGFSFFFGCGEGE